MVRQNLFTSIEIGSVNNGFAGFIDVIWGCSLSRLTWRSDITVSSIQYSASDGAGGVGLRKLLMEPVQRIPRYTPMSKGGFNCLRSDISELTLLHPAPKAMLKYMDPSDLQRAKLIEVHDAASKIAQAETDHQTRRVAVMIGLE